MLHRIFAALLVLLVLPTRDLRADGGTVRLSEQVGAYRLTIFTDPTPARVGRLDASVLVQDAATNAVRTDLSMMVELERLDGSGLVLRQHATRIAATNKLFRAAEFNVPTAGRWRLTAELDAERRSQASCEIEIAEPLAGWQRLWAWYCWPALVVVWWIVTRK